MSKSYRSTHMAEIEEDAAIEAPEHRKVPDPFPRNLNNDTTSAALADVKPEVNPDEERIPEIVKESTVWDVYNNEARKVDKELVKDWTDSLNSLLLFVAIFAVVLTAFIIESKTMLEPDQTEILVDITIQYFNSIGSQSRNNLTRPDFEPTFAAISINCLLFASLGTSLVAALASVVALQWVADYDAALTRGGSSPLDRAKRRQFRFAGVTHWKMGELIAALPLLLYSSVVLFWAGAIQWMWALHQVVGSVVAGGTAIAVLFYVSTTLLGAVYVSSPFRTPLSKGLYWLSQWSLSLMGRFLLWLQIEGALRLSSKLYQTISLYIRSLLTSRATLDVQSTTSQPIRDFSPARRPLSEAIPEWIKIHLTSSTSRNREDEYDPALEQEALAWLAQQLPISNDSHKKLLFCVNGIVALSTENQSSPRFHDAPWLAILEVLSKHFLRQIFDPNSSDKNYREFGILLHCIKSRLIRDKVVSPANYIQNPRDAQYWRQCFLEEDGILYFEAEGRTPLTFLLARDVPVPSLESKYELEATWKLIRWRNSISTSGLTSGQPSAALWGEVFSDIGRYSPGFLTSCLGLFRIWTNVFRYHTSGVLDYAIIFDSIVQQALNRKVTIGEASALVQAFAGYLSESAKFGFLLNETVDETNIVQQPFSYALAVGLSSESTRATHLAITLLVVLAARSSVSEKEPQWAKWIIYMLWISIPKGPAYWDVLRMRLNNKEQTREIWDEMEFPLPNATIKSPRVQEIGRILYQVDNAMTWRLSRDALKGRQMLRYLELLLQWVPHYYAHRTGSQHLLLHLYQGAQTGYPRTSYARFNTEPDRFKGFEWIKGSFNPILAMLALSDNQTLECLHLEGVGPECAKRILEIVEAVKRQPISLICLLTDIVNATDREVFRTDLALIVDSIKESMRIIGQESVVPYLYPLASGLEKICQQARSVDEPDRHVGVTVDADAQRICDLLRSKYAPRPITSTTQLRQAPITSTTQLRLLCCTRSVAVAKPATGWLGMHVPL